jgi:hypothetical protein
LTENHTPDRMMRVRIVSLPRIGDIDELGLRSRFRIGETYELPVQTAATLIIAGYAESPAGTERAVAADASWRRKPRTGEP